MLTVLLYFNICVLRGVLFYLDSMDMFTFEEEVVVQLTMSVNENGENAKFPGKRDNKSV